MSPLFPHKKGKALKEEGRACTVLAEGSLKFYFQFLMGEHSRHH